MTFFKKATHPLSTLAVTLEIYEHTVTGAQHYHFVSKKKENVCMIALATMPKNSRGMAHILEHTALCGSERFPVRDPFFSMIRRSLSTFMNAFTSSDWTGYPFATQNKQDFQNLLDMYLDAVFFPKLAYLDFLQEGHRFAFEEDGSLVTKGVVYNEMKGVYGDVFERNGEILKSFLQPETTYHYDSGGEPRAIIDLSYEELIAFHKKHYHPTNAIFFTFGDIPAKEHQKKFQSQVLAAFPSRGEPILPEDEKRFLAPMKVETVYPIVAKNDTHKIHVLVSWLLPFAHTVMTSLECHFLYGCLFNSSASTFLRTLEAADFCEAPSLLASIDDSGREFRFNTGAMVADEAAIARVEPLILTTLQEMSAGEFEVSEAEEIIDGMEINLRNQNSSFPEGLTLMFRAIGPAIHKGDIVQMLDPSAELALLRKKIQDPKYVSSLIQKYLLENPHRLQLVITPSEKAFQEEARQEKALHAQIAQKLSLKEKEEIQAYTKALENAQKKKKNEDILPRLRTSDIPEKMLPIQAEKITKGTTYLYQGATNCLGKSVLFFPLHNFGKEAVEDLQFLSYIFSETGYGSKDYLETQKEMVRYTGGIGATIRLGNIWNTQEYQAFFLSSVFYLERKSTEARRFFCDFVTQIHFKEHKHIRDIFQEKYLSLSSNFLQQGHHIASLRACAGLNLAASFRDAVSGLSSAKKYEYFLSGAPDIFQNTFSTLYTRVLGEKPYTVSIGGKNSEYMPSPLHQEKSVETAPFAPSFQKTKIQEAWIFDSGVSYCSLALPVVGDNHPDAPVLTLLAKFLHNEYLHRVIREQGGAYGSAASYYATWGIFTFSSYRDPHIHETFEAFQNSIDWFLTHTHDPLRLEEAKLGVFSSIDTPTSVMAESLSDFSQTLFGYTQEVHNQRRKELLAVSYEDMKRVAKTYFSDFSCANRVVLTGAQNEAKVQTLGLTLHKIST